VRRLLPALLLLASAAGAQDIDEIRDLLRESLEETQFVRSLAGVITVANDFELSSARLRFHDDGDTELSIVAFPFRTVLRPFGSDAPGLYLEGVLGWAQAKAYLDDLWDGDLPGAETRVGARWTTYGGTIGLGPQFRLRDDLTVTPILNGGLARLESDADYAGPGAELSAAIVDGIGFNWDALTWSGGGALRVDWNRPVGRSLELELIARYDLRWFGTFETDDPAQEFTARTQVVSLRGDLLGPFGRQVFGDDLYWRATLAYRGFLEGDLNDSQHIVEVGGAIEVDVSSHTPLAGRVSLSAAAFVGDQVTGWTVGVGFRF